MSDELQAFVGPLQAKLRLRFRSKSAWDDFVPYRKLSELTEYTRGLDPDDLVYAVAEGADKFTAAFRGWAGPQTDQAFERLIDRAKGRADRFRPAWRAHLNYIENAAPRAHINALVKTAQFLCGGNVTIGGALQEAFMSLFDLDETDEVAKEAAQFGVALDAFTDGVLDDFENLVLPALRRDIEAKKARRG